MMKYFQPHFLITYALLTLLLISFSCNSNKIPSVENHTMTLTLEDNLSGKYIKNQYQKYSPIDIKKSNKTLNQYMVVFSCNSSKYNILQDELANDSSILKFNNQNSTNNTIQSGKNESHGKSKSIRNDN
jgi:hypothetical protein